VVGTLEGGNIFGILTRFAGKVKLAMTPVSKAAIAVSAESTGVCRRLVCPAALTPAAGSLCPENPASLEFSLYLLLTDKDRRIPVYAWFSWFQ
jgi:hypothetical protein